MMQPQEAGLARLQILKLTSCQISTSVVSMWRTWVPAAVRHAFGRRVSAGVAYLPQETVIGSRGTLLRAVTLIIWLHNTVLCLSTDGRLKRLLDRQWHPTTNTVDTVGCRRDINDHRT